MAEKILTFEDKFGARTLAAHAAKNGSSTGDRTMPKEGVAIGVSAVARVNTGRWIADCPTSGCEGAEYVSFASPVIFCCECRNADDGNHPVAVVVPDADTRAAIEAALLARPDAKTRNWREGETSQDLLAENAEYGAGE